WELDPLCPSIRLCLVNMAHGKDGYRHAAVDAAFSRLLDEYKPDIVHIGHLNHLSTSLLAEAHQRGFPLLFTLHDFWLMCPRGQFLQGINSKTEDLYPVCHSQENGKCAKQCYWRYFSDQEDEQDILYWTHWVGKRMEHIREIASYIDLFIAPSHYLRDRFIEGFNTEPSKIIYLDYGFQRERLQGRKRKKENDFIFGYIGTHKQAKGIFDLLKAFSQIEQNAQLKIWGSPLQPFTSSLQSYVKSLGNKVESRIHWMGAYRNDAIVTDVFNHVDAIVVPSIWGENSPLVIHEALEAKVPIITADYGGMKEYVHHEVNGFLFEHRNPNSLALQMKNMIRNPEHALKIGQRGYLQSEDGHIPSIQEHAQQILAFYKIAIERRSKFYDKTETRPLAHHL
ncbi:MAG TPA: glycosyltransferase, partial [Candidatus Babeliaceae bacterium]|nr:glycosyltransferase [Candidatus Babeliaceae bacterium]